MTVTSRKSLDAAIAALPGPSLSDRPHRCPCGREYDAEQWADLPLFVRLTALDLTSMVTFWPEQRVIEVRSCAGCRQPMSRATRAPPVTPPLYRPPFGPM